ncbi:fumarylacetoacetate hydrolase family protein [Paraburkholderia agricolaris]|uniref:fumarylacetoacetate hydrolase family protein n=1 Tax=Paraburkholderia agricolaris TaxID=2152888 RepID=UPI0038B7967C
MKLATLRDGTVDGQLVLVDKNSERVCAVTRLASTLQQALDRWDTIAAPLRDTYTRLCANETPDAHPLNWNALMAPLPRGYQWLDASAYLRHVELVRRARGAAMPPAALTDPVMYQGVSSPFLPWNADIEVLDASWGPDFEAELVVITGDLAMGASKADCGHAIRLIGLANDISLRGLIPDELAKGFGFIHGKPPTAFGPIFVTPDELGDRWDGERAHLELHVAHNTTTVGRLQTGVDMHFSFADLLHHAAKTRPLCAGTVLGAGTVSNHGKNSGYGCIAERRAEEIIKGATPLAPYLADGDTVRIEAFARAEISVFGRIEQRVRYASPR